MERRNQQEQSFWAVLQICFFLNCIKFTEKYLCWSLFLIKLIAVMSKQQFSAKHACLNLATEKQEQRLYACFDLFIVDFECIHAQTRWSGCIELLNECLSLFLCLWCWIWANMYAFMYIFYASIDVRENFVFDSHLRALYKKKLLWVKSNLCSSQDKTIEFYSYSEYLFMWKIFYPVQYFAQIVSMLAMFGQFFIYIFSRQATYLRYIGQHILSTFVIYALHKHFPSASYHLTRWQKQICHFVSVIWVEHLKVLWDWGCKSCDWIVWQYLIGFFWCYLVDAFVHHYIVRLNRSCSRTLVE